MLLSTSRDYPYYKLKSISRVIETRVCCLWFQMFRFLLNCSPWWDCLPLTFLLLGLMQTRPRSDSQMNQQGAVKKLLKGILCYWLPFSEGIDYQQKLEAKNCIVFYLSAYRFVRRSIYQFFCPSVCQLHFWGLAVCLILISPLNTWQSDWTYLDRI